MKRIARAGRHLVLDLTPLRRSRDLRFLFAGQFASTLGSQLTTVAVPYQVYTLTHSSLDVGLVSLAQLLPLIAGALLGGALADAADRRRVLLIAQLLTALCSVGLAVNADTGPLLWPLFILPPWARAAGRRRVRRRHLGGVPQHDHPAAGPGRRPGGRARFRCGRRLLTRPRE